MSQNRYGQLIDNCIKLAPTTAKINGIVYSRLTDDQYINDLNCKLIVDQKPIPTEGYDVAFDHYDETDTEIRLVYKQVEAVREHKEISKFKLQLALLRIGLWNTFIEWLKSTELQIAEGITISCYEAWNNALVLDVNDPMFIPYINQVKEMFSEFLTPDQMTELIENCKAE